jgi:hypothetical protein
MHQDHRQSAEAFAKKYNIRHKLAIATCHKLLSEMICFSRKWHTFSFFQVAL